MEYLTSAPQANGHVVKLGDRGHIDCDGPNNATGTWDYWKELIVVQTIFRNDEGQIYVSKHINAVTGYYLSHFKPVK